MSSVCRYDAFVEDEAGCGRVGKFLDQVAATDFDRLQAELRRGGVYQPLQRHRDHRPRYAAIGRHRTGVGEHAARDAGISANIVWTGKFGHRHQRLDRASRRIAGISTDIGDDLGGQCDKLGIGVERALEADILIAAVERRHQVLAAIFSPGDRASQFASEPDQHDIFGDERHFLPEPAADIRGDDAQLAFRHSNQVSDCGPHQMRHLRGAGQRDAAGNRIERGMARARLRSAWRSGVASAPRS